MLPTANTCEELNRVRNIYLFCMSLFNGNAQFGLSATKRKASNLARTVVDNPHVGLSYCTQVPVPAKYLQCFIILLPFYVSFSRRLGTILPRLSMAVMLKLAVHCSYVVDPYSVLCM